MDPWSCSSFTQKDADNLVWRGLIHPMITDVVQPEWRLPSNEDHPNPLPGYIVSFAHFHKRGFGIPMSRFFRGLLHHYRIKLQNLNPNSVLQITVFVALCEGYLGIKPNFALWRNYFCATAFLKTVRRGETAAPELGGRIHLHEGDVFQQGVAPEGVLP
jgi:hypothetical protein